MTEEPSRQRLQREIEARKQAESLLESKSAELYDINEQLKASANELILQTMQLSTIISHIWSGVLLADGDLKIVRSNAYAQRSFKKRRLIGKQVTDLILCSDEELQTILNNSISLDPGLDGVELNAVHAKGGTFPIKLHVVEAKIRDENNTIWIFQDLTSQKQSEEAQQRLEEELQRAQRLEALGTLASGIAHEINTPMQYIHDNLHFLQESFTDLFETLDTSKPVPVPNPEKKKEEKETENQDNLDDFHGDLLDDLYDDSPIEMKDMDEEDEIDLEFILQEVPDAISQALDGVSRVTEIISSVRIFSHPGAKQHIEVNLNDSIQSAVTVSRNQWKQVADMDLDLSSDLPSVECIPGEVNQVLLNLIVNAAQAIESNKKSGCKGKISIVSSLIEDQVEIRVSDTGCGIPAESRDKIFDPFYTTKEVGKGTGQGLALAHNVIVKTHNGKITFETEVGEGTSFILRLPQKQPSQVDAIA